MKYFLMVKGNGIGCDYAIGCNMYFKEFEANTREEADDRANKAVEDLGWSKDSPIAEEVILVEASHIYRPACEDIQRRMREEHEAEQRKVTEAKQRAQYEQLKAKFG